MQPKSFSYVTLIICTLLIQLFSHSVAAEGLRFLRNGPIAFDVLNRQEWFRCSVGQQWVKDNCKGDVLKLTIEQANQVANILTARHGPGWRLPTLKELQSLVESNNKPPKINQLIFPNTYKGPYWTADNNKFMKNNNWSVNFYTGQSYARFFRYQKLAVRFIRNKKGKN